VKIKTAQFALWKASKAVADLKARGLSVTFYPFVMMDVPPGNTLVDPYTGAAGQQPFPWRGRITCDPAPGRAGTPDGAASAATQIDAFFAGYRNFVLHYAQLCQSAGGVDAFLIGSELIGLTRVRSAPGQYPAVDALLSLASDVKAIVGAGTKLSYAADWTEYNAHVLASGELRFPLDPLWASPSVDFIGVDVYWPLSDWRERRVPAARNLFRKSAEGGRTRIARPAEGFAARCHDRRLRKDAKSMSNLANP
jgi:hypothetical protein